MNEQRLPIERELHEMFARRSDDVVTPAAMPSQVRRRITMRRSIYAAVGVAAVVAIATTAAVLTGGSDTPELPPVETERSAQPIDPDAPSQSLVAGTYVAEHFALPFTFEVAEDERVTVHNNADGKLVVLNLGGAGIELMQVEEVFDPDGRETVPAPDDLLRWFETNPLLDVEAVGETQVGGVSATRMTLRPARLIDDPACHVGIPPPAQQPCVPLTSPADGPRLNSLVEGSAVHVFVLEADDEQITLTIFRQGGTEPDLRVAEGFLESFDFVD